MMFGSVWIARAAPSTTFLPNDCGAPSNMRRSISKITPVLVRRGKSCEPTCVFITSAVFTRRLAIVHQQRFTLLSQERRLHLSSLDFGVLTIWVTLLENALLLEKHILITHCKEDVKTF